MTTSPAPRHLAVVGRTSVGQPRTFRLETSARPAASRDAAYRRLASVLLGLDVPTLAFQLSLARAHRTRSAAA